MARPNFMEKTFVGGSKTVKFVKVFSLESFLLYGIEHAVWSGKLSPLLVPEHTYMYNIHVYTYISRSRTCKEQLQIKPLTLT